MKKLVLLSLVLVLGGCGPQEALVPSTACKSIPAGKLVITEVFADPAGDDSGKEWFEVWNGTGAALDVAGLELLYSRPDGTSPKTHTIKALKMPAGYFVFGSVAPTSLPSYVNYGYTNDLGALGNSAGHLALRCGGVTLDAIDYADVHSGASRALSGGVDPSATDNDMAQGWCDGTAGALPDIAGTPGAPNPVCGAQPSVTTCKDGATTRDIKSPQAGDVVISELMPNPHAVGDTDGEWFEITLRADIDLNGLQIGTTPGSVRATLTDANCRRRAAGTRIVFARSADAAKNGGLPAVEGTFGFDLSNSGGTLFVGAKDAVLDQIVWTRSSDGASTSLDPGKVDAAANDDESVWCPSETLYGDGDRGSPGAANDPCPAVLPPGQCTDGDVVRPTVAPHAGDLVISEVMANPSGADDGKEWFEVYVTRDVDLNGVELGTASPTVLQTLQSARCLSVAAGSYLVFSHNDGVASDGGLPHVDFRTRFDLGNTSPALFLGLGGQLLDAVSLATATDGASTSLNPEILDPTANDDRKNWCVAASPYGDGTNRGTPGALNYPGCADPTRCVENGVLRAIVSPKPGQLVISEVMPDPSAVGDEDGEWIELTLLADVDLNNLQLGTVPGTPRQTIADAACRRRSAGTQILFARNPDRTENGGLPSLEGPLAFSLTNSDGSVFVSSGGVLLDAVGWSRVTPGSSYSLDPGKTDATQNDNATSWCPGTSSYGDGDHGTPAAPNDLCPVVVADGKCLEGGVVRAVVPPAAGDLVITEVMADPSGTDTGKEWFELRVTRDVDLAGLEMGTAFPTVAGRVPGPDCRRVRAGSLLVFAAGDGSLPDGGLPRVDYRFNFTLVNSERGLFVGAGGALVDEMSYTTVRSGTARALTASKQTATANDDLAAWCDAGAAYGDGDKGTPGTANPECPVPLPPGQCMDGTAARQAVAPKVGDLVITEVLPDPSGSDDGREWFEVLVKRDVDLNGLQLGATFPTVLQTLSQPGCLRVFAGESLIFAHNDGAQPDGGLPRIDVHTTFSLVNSDRGVFLGVAGAAVDEITYTDTTSGRARSLSRAATDPVANDDLIQWCDAVEQYSFDGFGTPGFANPKCPEVLPAGSCRDASGVRTIVTPRAGDLVISEIMPDPAGADAGQEWFEVTVKRDVDLNGVQLGTTFPTVRETLAGTDCLRVRNGQQLVFAHNDGSIGDGGLPRVDFRFGFDLVNADRGVFLALPSRLIDNATYAQVEAGVARSLDGDKVDATVNDDLATWCDATSSYGPGGLGTPGAPNPTCPFVPPPGKCLDGETVRDLVKPAAGDLVITEIMADPSGADTGKEWFEVLATRAVDLNGVQIGISGSSPGKQYDSSSCLHVDAGSYLVFGQEVDGVDSGLPRVDFTLPFSLINSDRGVFLSIDDDHKLLDEATYSEVTPGTARSLSFAKTDSTQNDSEGNWCDATARYGDPDLGDFGSPGAANPTCPFVPPPGECVISGETSRPIVKPVKGDLIITEIMADPSGGDTGHEWFEVLVTRDVDLNGLAIGTTSPPTDDELPATGPCRPVTAGTLLLFGDGDLVDVTPVDVTVTFSLANLAGGTVYLGSDGQIIDGASYPPTTQGVARSLSSTKIDPDANDLPESWCDAVTRFGDPVTGDLGTPGQANPECAIPGQCKDALSGMFRPIVAPMPGQLVVSELFADATGADAGKEWFELLVKAHVDLNGLEIGFGATPGTVRTTYNPVECLDVAAQSYLVFAHNDGSVSDGGLPRVDFRFAGTDLVNSGGGVWVGIGADVLDAMTYSSLRSGKALGLSNAKLDATENDDELVWCDATDRYGDPVTGDFGTPGGANPVCPLVLPAGKCLDGETVRDVEVPKAGDLVITEVFADPLGSDTGREWFEVHVNAAVDLNGLQIGTTAPSAQQQTLASLACVRVSADSDLIFAHNDGAQPDGGLPRVDQRFTFSLGDPAGDLFLGNGTDKIDQVAWSSVGEAAAWTLSGDVLDETGNDDPSAWCDAAAEYNDAGELGSPGEPNLVCPPPGDCLEGDVARSIVPPGAGDLVISEVFPDATGADDGKEWFEVYARNPVDLNGLEIGVSDVARRYRTSACLAAPMGSYILFSHNDGTQADGGLTGVDLLFDFSLTLSGGLFIGRNGEVLDDVSYSASSGKSRSLSAIHLDAGDNDDDSVWCNATAKFGDQVDFGTPGAQNPICPLPAGRCLDEGTGMERDILAPMQDDLVISEFMANPGGGVVDGDGEWFEVTVLNPVDLRNLQLGTTGAALNTLSEPECRRVQPGTRLVFAHKTSGNGELPHVDALFTFGLTDNDGGLFIGYGGAQLDSIGWTSVAAGASTSLDPDNLTSLGNDGTAGWCPGVATYGLGGKGTPGAANPECLAANECLTPLGTARLIVPPVAGDLIITEYLANPGPDSGSGDDFGFEWFEVLVTRDVDLNGVTVRRTTSTQTYTSSSCLAVTMGSRLIFANGTAENARLPRVDFSFPFSLNNSGSCPGGVPDPASPTLGLRLGATVLDDICYTAVPNFASRSVKTASTSTGGNDATANWCISSTLYPDETGTNKGTPGSADLTPACQ